VSKPGDPAPRCDQLEERRLDENLGVRLPERFADKRMLDGEPVELQPAMLNVEEVVVKRSSSSRQSPVRVRICPAEDTRPDRAPCSPAWLSIAS